MKTTKEEKLEHIKALKEKKKKQEQEVSAKVIESLAPKSGLQTPNPNSDYKTRLDRSIEAEHITLAEAKKLFARMSENLLSKINEQIENKGMAITIKQEWKTVPFNKFSLKKMEELSEDGWRYAFVSTDPDNNYEKKNIVLTRNINK